MKYTSSEANKLLRRLNEERDAVLVKEQKSSTFLAAMGEDPESVRPKYDYTVVQNMVAELDLKIRTVKHAINQFNLPQTVPGFDMTVDQMLVYIPQLTARKNKTGFRNSVRQVRGMDISAALSTMSILTMTLMPRKQTITWQPMSLQRHRQRWIL